MTRLSEVEVSGDTAVVRALLSHLQDRTRIPAEVLIFHEDERPGYFGTFTKDSRLVKPRRPFARDDIALDYTYGSGAEGGGDDVLGDSDDDRDDEEESDDLDGWLVDGDEEEVATPVEEREGLDEFPFPPTSESSKRKRKAGKEKETDTDGKAKKRKVVPLVPFVMGPCWETEIGGCEPFNQYRIQFFNGKFLSFHPRSLAKLCWSKIHHTPSTRSPLFRFQWTPEMRLVRPRLRRPGQGFSRNSLCQRCHLISSTPARRHSKLYRLILSTASDNHSRSVHERYLRIHFLKRTFLSLRRKWPAWGRQA